MPEIWVRLKLLHSRLIGGLSVLAIRDHLSVVIFKVLFCRKKIIKSKVEVCLDFPNAA